MTPAERAAVADYWRRQDVPARVRWFVRAGFREAYSAPTFEHLSELLPETAAAIGRTIIAAGALQRRPGRARA